MKKVNLLHNPTAGDNDFTKKELAKLIKEEGFECSYASVKEEGWDNFNDETDFLVVAGGDGTVRRIAKALMRRRVLDKQFPVALLPHGTANNIAAALGIGGEVRDIVKKWHHHHLKPFDIGKIRGAEGDLFFLEGFGYGIFPRLMKVMDKMREEDIGTTVEEKLKTARIKLADLAGDFEARPCRIVADGKEYSDNYLMVEIMNIRSIGPNLVLAPHADPGDGWFNVAMVAESQRPRFESYLQALANGEKHEFDFTAIQARNITITCEFKEFHADDERMKSEEPLEINVELLESKMQFVVTDK
ncbi:diacylglycerol kinase family protein [Dyadobacter sp. CY323]|uniref:diacylglycerol/lipid kinase family protein n=1 Tax=Dyadobacter sp. CY323 TaxID=2907302 RepID=UPI001F21BF1F|nr:diacylglycerol kinase family protein [Dyadobacter sp. CY323]MCE6987860.1 diacylglycerol kinase [Dyadobacter sp. CY323]